MLLFLNVLATIALLYITLNNNESSKSEHSSYTSRDVGGDGIRKTVKQLETRSSLNYTALMYGGLCWGIAFLTNCTTLLLISQIVPAFYAYYVLYT